MQVQQEKRFSNWLVVSDIDGTLNTKLRTLPKNNWNAIQRFTKDLGGNFTLASGRSVRSMEKHYRRLPEQKTPGIVLNGAGIYDYQQRKMLQFSSISKDGMSWIRELYEQYTGMELQICTADHIYLLRPRLFGPVMLGADQLAYTCCGSWDQVPTEGWGKVIFMGLPRKVSTLKKQAEGTADAPVNCMSSSIVTFEMLPKGVHKGTAVLDLADRLGIPHTHTAAIGDYFNDYDMLKTVGVSAACGQAPREMREMVDFVSCHCNQGAVAKFLAYLEEECS